MRLLSSSRRKPIFSGIPQLELDDGSEGLQTNPLRRITSQLEEHLAGFFPVHAAKQGSEAKHQRLFGGVQELFHGPDVTRGKRDENFRQHLTGRTGDLDEKGAEAGNGARATEAPSTFLALLIWAALRLGRISLRLSRNSGWLQWR